MWNKAIDIFIDQYNKNGQIHDVSFDYINTHLPSELVHPYQLDESISNLRDVWLTFSFLFYF